MGGVHLKVACIQPNSGQNMQANIETVCNLIQAAEKSGAQFIALPENVVLMDHRPEIVKGSAYPAVDHPAIHAFAKICKECGIWILAGSVGTLASDGRVANCSVLLNSDGAIVAKYNKIHMFDVDLQNGEVYRESETFYPGNSAVIVNTPWGRLGMSICYDLRFPQLFRKMAQQGVSIIVVPAAFTRETGKQVWHILNRARAIECASFIISPCMWGEHSGGRTTYGHSLVVDPWGKILADGGEGVCFVTTKIDLTQVDKARSAIPALSHDKEFSLRVSNIEQN